MGWTRAAFPERLTGALMVVLLVAATVLAAPTPVRSVDGRPDHLPAYSACVGDATDPTGFRDVVGHFAEQGINCLAYYGITVGKTPDRFAPDEPITRWQMAMFLVRAAVPAGIAVPEPASQGFVDIGHHAPHIQDAINQLAAMGITRGTSPVTFHPDSPMDRRQMALFLHRFLLLAPTGPGGANASRVIPDDDVFKDLQGQPDSVITAVRVMYELGVTVGVTATTFSPETLLTRAQMALFVTRALAHTNSRPAGVTVQSALAVISAGDTLDVQISVRSQGFLPRAGLLVDVFTTSADDPYASFDSHGTCLRGAEVAFGGRACAIDRSDQRLDEFGNLQVVLEPPDNIRLWAWTGSLGNEFRLDTTPSTTIDIQVLKPASAIRVTDDMPTTAQAVKLGDPIRFVFQLVDEDGRSVGEAGHRVQVSTTYETNGVSDLTTVKTHRTDAGGRVAVSFQAPDPDRTADDDETMLDIDVLVQALAVMDGTTLGVVAGDDSTGDVRVAWSEGPPVATTLRLRQTVAYHELTEGGPSPVNVVRAILTDQYGDAVAGAGIEFRSDDGSGLGQAPVARNTDARGAVSLRYLWSGTGPSSELISAETAGGAVTAQPVYHYWAASQAERRSALGVPIVLQDVRNNVILHDAASPKLVRYDDNDRLSIRGTPVRIESFEEALYSGAYARISYGRYSHDPEKVNSFDLTNTREFEDA